MKQIKILAHTKKNHRFARISHQTRPTSIAKISKREQPQREEPERRNIVIKEFNDFLRWSMSVIHKLARSLSLVIPQCRRPMKFVRGIMRCELFSHGAALKLKWLSANKLFVLKWQNIFQLWLTRVEFLN